MQLINASDFKDAKDGTLTLALSQAQERLKAQADLVRAADSRAQSLLSVSAAFLSISIGAAISGLNYHIAGLPPAGLTAAFFLALGAMAAIKAFAPQDFDVPGWPPSSLATDFRKGATYEELVVGMLVHLEDMINDNRSLMKAHARYTTFSMSMLIFGPVAGLVASLLVK